MYLYCGHFQKFQCYMFSTEFIDFSSAFLAIPLQCTTMGSTSAVRGGDLKILFYFHIEMGVLCFFFVCLCFLPSLSGILLKNKR